MSNLSVALATFHSAEATLDSHEPGRLTGLELIWAAGNGPRPGLVSFEDGGFFLQVKQLTSWMNSVFFKTYFLSGS